MRSRRIVAALLLLVAGCSEPPEQAGFAGLAESGQSPATVPFLQPEPGDRLTFPEDFGPHPQHRIEWWYLTANLETSGGEPLGLQWTQFRQTLEPRPPTQAPPPPSRWPLQAAWKAHGAVSWTGQHRFAEKLARGDVGHAGATAEPFEVWLDDWQLTSEGGSDAWRLQVSAADWSYDLSLRVQGEPVAHGEAGFSAKSASGEGSMYFSLVDIAIEGTVTVDGQTLSVRGKGWFDREWSSQLLKAGQQGWDWFALHLDSGDKLMAFRLREGEGGFVSGTWIPAAGEPVALGPGDLMLTPGSLRGDMPTRWRLQVPDYGVDLSVKAPPGDYRNRGQFPYWESPVSVTGSHSGEGYMELTGYGGE
ncbi:lipocalin-like domain-containing protein [Marinobacter sp. M216]|uniref:Lipocalin-like domain-containing protein n=1 Tax=Marinobacter albus TaxID=3030833 RepID=A0ABT7HE55_9GAMM|nr:MULTISPECIES: lipocalin-like domain-containing protein [unclassified Marinobacter]MBW7472071.1 carotenoid 1,2-hydratase [Marinobacter sp. F4218]MDK9558641.1 lipocalin-like domain-containing protein [Marinobacter sp. M216]